MRLLSQGTASLRSLTFGSERGLILFSFSFIEVGHLGFRSSRGALYRKAVYEKSFYAMEFGVSVGAIF